MYEAMTKPSIDGTGGPRNGRYLCICADDFGMSEGINAAVFDLADRGKISAAGCMVHRSAWASGAIGLREISPSRFDLGLHLDLSRPLQGRLSEPGLSGLIARSYLGLLRPELVRAEIKDQLARFEDGLGRPPAFVDGHRHVHQLPVVREALVEEIASRYGSATPWIRNTTPFAPRRIARTKADVVFALGGAKLLELAARHRIPTSSRLLGVYGFTGSAEDYQERLQRWVGDCRTGDVLMCHPSLGDTPADPISPARRNEYAVLGAITFPMETKAGTVFLAPLSHRGHNPLPAD
jgi:predicted glycoside hydrolase/deacetylase ChbG (UPF0249 family)